jgi:hypothetical protein
MAALVTTVAIELRMAVAVASAVSCPVKERLEVEPVAEVVVEVGVSGVRLLAVVPAEVTKALRAVVSAAALTTPVDPVGSTTVSCREPTGGGGKGEGLGEGEGLGGGEQHSAAIPTAFVTVPGQA